MDGNDADVSDRFPFASCKPQQNSTEICFQLKFVQSASLFRVIKDERCAVEDRLIQQTSWSKYYAGASVLRGGGAEMVRNATSCNWSSSPSEANRLLKRWQEHDQMLSPSSAVGNQPREATAAIWMTASPAVPILADAADNVGRKSDLAA